MRGKSLAYRKKLIEVSLPLDAINAASAREKSIRHGHPSTLHLWWARRPLAACRAVLFAQLVDDPSSCPDEFPTLEAQEAERQRLHGIIEAMVPWEASTNQTILHAARYEIARSVARNGGPALSPEWRKPAHARDVIDYLQAHAPPVHDPFSGGGSIPLEAQRLGLRARGSDLNPVAVLIGKALVEFPPKFADMPPVNPEADRHVSWKGAKGLADDVRYYGRWMRKQAVKRIGHLYPKAKLPGGGEATVIAWLWARTVPSPDPRAKGAHVPLVSTYVLSAKPGREAIIRPVVDRHTLSWTFEVDRSPSKEEVTAARAGTKSGRGFTCLLSGTPLEFDYIRGVAKQQGFGHRLIAIVAEGDRERIYLSPSPDHEEAAESALIDWKPVGSLAPYALGFRVPEYGMTEWSDLFSDRQMITLTTFYDLLNEVFDRVASDAQTSRAAGASTGSGCSDDYAGAVATYLAFAINRMADLMNNLCQWRNDASKQHVGHLFARQAISMTWDWGEANCFASSAGSWDKCLHFVPRVIEELVPTAPGTLVNEPAQTTSFHGEVVSTDPPYYDNVGYADLSDFFYVWLRHGLRSIQPDLFRRIQTPKDQELVATPGRHGGRAAADAFFMDGMKETFSNISNQSADLPVTIYYAFKQNEVSAEGMTSSGWASFLQAVVDHGFVIDGTWPLRSELANRTRGQASNALASSIVLVCRRRDADAETVTRPDFLRRLRAEMPASLATIRAAGVGPTDIQQAAIGPGIGVFTRYAAVLNTDGEPMSVRDALKLVNQVREEIASEGEGDYDADTRFAIDWFVAHGFAAGKAGDAISMANAANLGLADLIAAGVLEAKGGEARLLRRADMPADWDPRKDKRPTAWEACQNLIRRLEAEDGGIDAAAQLFAVLGDLTEPAHQLAFRLYDICEKKGWHAEGRPYNLLIQEWAEIENRAFALRDAPPAQGEMAV